MIKKIRSLGTRNITCLQAAIVILLFMFAVTAIAARHENLSAKILWAQYIKPLMASATGHYWLEIGDKDRPSNSGVTIVGQLKFATGTTVPPIPQGIALLSGTTGDICWGVNTSGASGWHLTADNLKNYKEFMVQAQFPGGLVSGASQYSDNAGQGLASTGNTVYLTGCLVAEIHGREWTFTHALSGGTTAFYIYDANGRFNAGSGTTEGVGVTANSSAPDTVGDSVTVKAIVFPSEVSGWYVTNISAKQ